MRNMNHLKKRLGLYKSKIKDTDYLATPFLVDVLGLTDNLIIDWTDEQSPIKNQGNEGSCAGHAGVAWAEWVHIKDYDLTPETYIDLSERYLYELAKAISGHKEGTTLLAIAEVLITNGVCREEFWKYIPNQPGNPESEADKDAENFKAKIYTRITNEKELKASLIKTPIQIGVMVRKNWYRQKNGVIPNSSFCDRIKPLGGHAVLLVGYDYRTGLYKFKNSWGKGSGDSGYWYMTDKEMKGALMDAIYMVDIDDTREWEDVKKTLPTVAGLSKIEKKKLKKREGILI